MLSKLVEQFTDKKVTDRKMYRVTFTFVHIIHDYIMKKFSIGNKAQR